MFEGIWKPVHGFELSFRNLGSGRGAGSSTEKQTHSHFIQCNEAQGHHTLLSYCALKTPIKLKLFVNVSKSFINGELEISKTQLYINEGFGNNKGEIVKSRS